MNMMTKTLAAASLCFAAALAPATLAQDTIVSYATFPWNDTNQGERVSVAGDTTLEGVTGIEMTRNGGLLYTPTNNAFNSKGWATNADGDATVLNENAYVEIGFSLAPGYTATLDSLIMGSRSSTSGPSQVGVFTSIDGFTNPLVTIDQDSNFSNDIISLASLGEISGNFTIRFYNTGGINPAAPTAGEFDMDEDSTWRISDYFNSGNFTSPQITGEVVPEPSSLALLGLGGLLVARRRRG